MLRIRTAEWRRATAQARRGKFSYHHPLRHNTHNNPFSHRPRSREFILFDFFGRVGQRMTKHFERGKRPEAHQNRIHSRTRQIGNQTVAGKNRLSTTCLGDTDIPTSSKTGWSEGPHP
jgi:hypothetical protein